MCEISRLTSSSTFPKLGILDKKTAAVINLCLINLLGDHHENVVNLSTGQPIHSHSASYANL